jgi:hypothetical protein
MLLSSKQSLAVSTFILVSCLFFHRSEAQVTILPFGESTTWMGNSYRYDLNLLLKSAGITFDYLGSVQNGDAGLNYDRDNQGMSGCECARLRQWAHDSLALYPAQIVLLWEGINDCAWVWQYRDIKVDLETLVDTICAILPGSEVFVATLPPLADSAYTGNQFGVTWSQNQPGDCAARAIDFNNAMPGMVQRKQNEGKRVHFVDGRSVWTLSDVGPDYIHPLPSGFTKQAQVWYDAILPVIRPATGIRRSNSHAENGSMGRRSNVVYDIQPIVSGKVYDIRGRELPNFSAHNAQHTIQNFAAGIYVVDHNPAASIIR